VPAGTCWVTVPLPVTVVAGPWAVSVQLAATAVPKLLLTTCLTSVRVAGWSSLAMVQVALPPLASVIWLPTGVTPVHDQADAV
jgi:hypothetical protein